MRGDHSGGDHGGNIPHPHVDMAAAYDVYHGVGYYARRYPGPNHACLTLLEQTLAAAGPRLLDFGCGDGRYAAPLLDRTSASILAYDISHVAAEELAARCPREVAAGRLQIVCGGLDDLLRAAEPASFDVAAAMFGVLGHIEGRAARLEALSAMRRLLRPGGRLVATAPNARRRFHAEQTAAKPLIESGELEPGDILYAREADGVHVDLYYHLYQPGELEDEVRAAGFRPLVSTAESIFPERGVVLSRAARLADAALRRLLPLSMSYGFLVVAEADGK